ncbi:ATP/GTP-binding protein [Streptomyces sp. JB150]|uniref:ATP/GTP-binding protein n=1 Tax=Streptomyces sp. JB150 TaxID=2714844 RepID=UPI00140BA2F1|nr:ATP/GTP-binding protein [Streptomyces sp. JB150]QIJ63512.1 ATP/GTP-binding protein [Streptomyces sp. JB150]
MYDGQAPTPGEVATAAPARPVRLAPLKDGLPPEKRALAQHLRQLFLVLGIGVRRFAARQFIDPSSVTRYLNGERVPPWDFVTRIIEEVEKARAPLTPEAQAALWELHRAALKSNRHSSEMQALQDRLAEADEETRRITTRQRALQEALLDREGRLAKVRGRCRNLEAQLEEQRLAHRGEVELWRGEYARLQEESGDLQEQVIYLQEALAVTRAELIAAEDRCHRLESRLETLQALGGGEQDDDERPSIVAMLEEADRRSSVPELVRAVGDLELRTRKAMASELVRSAGQSRTVEEVAGLLSALRRAGFDTHAQTALPALLMVRSVDDTSALARELFRDGLEEYVVILVQASVRFHQPEDLADFALALHRAGLPEHAEGLLGAAAVVRSVPDLVSVTLTLAGGELDGAVVTAMSAAAAQRPVPDLVTLRLTLREVRLSRYADVLQRAVAAGRSASDVAEFLRALSHHGLERDAETVFALTQDRSIGHLIPLVQALRDGRAWSVLSRAGRCRPVDDVAVLISELHMAGRHQFAANLLVLTVRSRPVDQIEQLLDLLGGMAPGLESVMRTAARILTPAECAALLTWLEHHGLDAPAEAVFRCAVHDELAGQAGLFLAALAEAGSRCAGRDVLCRHASTMEVPTLAHLMLALESASLTSQLDAVITDRYLHGPVVDVALLVKRLGSTSGVGPRAERVQRRILHHMVRARSCADQAALVGALQAAGLGALADLLVTEALKAHGRQFKDHLTRERTKHEQKVMSRAFWVSDRPRPRRRDRRAQTGGSAEADL